jgi:CDP-glycerol glycerophosphotransferase (TagB/SpsB family)
MSIKIHIKILEYIYILFTKFISRKNIVCFISFPDIEDNCRELFIFICNNKNNYKKIIWLVHSLNEANEKIKKLHIPSNFQNKVFCIKKNSLLGFFYFLRAKHVFFTHGHYFFIRPLPNDNKLINLWHGMPLKAIGLLDMCTIPNSQSCDYTIASSPFFQEIMAAAFNLPKNRVLVTGLPRCDVLEAKKIAKLTILKNFLSPESQKLVFWMPTYQHSYIGDVRSDSKISKDKLAHTFSSSLLELDSIASKFSCRIILKLHPMDYLNHLNFSNLDNILVLKRNDSFFSSFGLYEALSIADGLITDVSSIAFDFMTTLKPILITTWIIKNYTRKFCFNSNLIFDSVYTCSNWNESYCFFNSIQNNIIIKKEKYQLFCNFFDSKSSERVYKSILNIN